MIASANPPRKSAETEANSNIGALQQIQAALAMIAQLAQDGCASGSSSAEKCATACTETAWADRPRRAEDGDGLTVPPTAGCSQSTSDLSAWSLRRPGGATSSGQIPSSAQPENDTFDLVTSSGGSTDSVPPYFPLAIQCKMSTLIRREYSNSSRNMRAPRRLSLDLPLTNSSMFKHS